MNMQIMVNGESRELTVATVAELLESLSMEPRRVAVELNRQIVPRAQHGETVLKDRDTLEIVTLVGGG